MKISKEDLKKALESVKPGLASNEFIEQTTCFAFTQNKVVTYNDEISISCPIEGLNIEGAIDAQEIYQFINKTKINDIELMEKEDQLIIKAGKSKAGFSMQPPNLPLEEIGKMGKWKVLPEDFCEGLKFTLIACGKDNSRPVLTCINVNKEFLEASDNIRIIRYRMNTSIDIPDFLIPGNSVKELIKLNPLKIASGESWVHFKAKNNVIISCRIVEDNFPDIRPHLKVKGKKIKLPKLTEKLIERAMIFSKREVSFDERIDINIKNDKLTISSKSEKGSWFEGVSNIEYNDDEINLSVIPQSLKDIINENNELTVGSNMIRFDSSKWIYVSTIKTN